MQNLDMPENTLALFSMQKSLYSVSFFFISLVFQVSFSFLDDAIVGEEGTGSEKKTIYSITKTK